MPLQAKSEFREDPLRVDVLGKNLGDNPPDLSIRAISPRYMAL
jgi:hypothetical protein